MKLWLLIADQGRARIFAASCNGGDLHEVEAFINPVSRVKDETVMADRAGRVRAGPHGQVAAAIPPHTARKEVEAERFAAEIAGVVRRARALGHWDHLALVAPPGFFSLVRDHLDEQSRQRLVACVQKDVARLEKTELAPHLAEVFAAAARADLEGC